MSYLVLHMDKFKKNAIRGIQSHNRRERESHSNPDIDYSRSAGNYDLHESASDNYAQAIQNRIDDLLMVKAVRKDAVHLCGLIVSSDKSFFTRMGKEETKRFFEEAVAYLTDFVGKENVISAMVHMDEKTPHMHFLHVPVTQDGRLSANSIYTRASLKSCKPSCRATCKAGASRFSVASSRNPVRRKSIWIRGNSSNNRRLLLVCGASLTPWRAKPCNSSEK